MEGLATPPPRVDPRVPLSGFRWDGARYVDEKAGYTFDPHTNLFRNVKTGNEYWYDTRMSRFRPKEARASPSY